MKRVPLVTQERLAVCTHLKVQEAEASKQEAKEEALMWQDKAAQQSALRANAEAAATKWENKARAEQRLWSCEGFILGWHVCWTKLARKIFFEARIFSRKMLRKFWAFILWVRKILQDSRQISLPPNKKNSPTSFCRSAGRSLFRRPNMEPCFVNCRDFEASSISFCNKTPWTGHLRVYQAQTPRTSPSNPVVYRHRFPDLTLFRCQIDPWGGEGEVDSRMGSEGPVPNKPFKTLEFPNAVILNAVVRRNTYKCAQISAKERKRESAKESKRAKKGAKEHRNTPKSGILFGEPVVCTPDSRGCCHFRGFLWFPPMQHPTPCL